MKYKSLTYDELALLVNSRYQQVKDQDQWVKLLKSEFGISTSMVFELIGISDSLEFGGNNESSEA